MTRSCAFRPDRFTDLQQVLAGQNTPDSVRSQEAANRVDGDVILTSDDMVRLKRLPRHMVVVGGGVIGIEYASMLAALKVNVTLVDKRMRLLEFVDSEIVDELMHQLRNRNVTFRLGEAVERLEVTGGEGRRTRSWR